MAQGKVVKGKAATKGSLRGVHEKQKAVAGNFVRSCGLSTAGLNSLLQGAMEDLADANVKVKRLPAPAAKAREYSASGGSGSGGGLLDGTITDMVSTAPGDHPSLAQPATAGLPPPQPNISSLLDGFKL